MQTLTMNNILWDIDKTFLRRLLWLTVVTLTMGLCLLTPKRLLVDELRTELLASQVEIVASSTVQSAATTPVKVVVNVCQVKYRPVWASAMAEADLIYEEYPQSNMNRIA